MRQFIETVEIERVDCLLKKHCGQSSSQAQNNRDDRRARARGNALGKLRNKIGKHIVDRYIFGPDFNDRSEWRGVPTFLNVRAGWQYR